MEENIVYSKYLGEESWVQIVKDPAGGFYEEENHYGGMFIKGQHFDDLEAAIKYADSCS